MKKIAVFVKKHMEIIALAFISICALALHLIMLDKIPGGWNIDEAGMAYDAWSMAHYGVDRYRYSYPLYLINFGGGQSVMYAYMAVILIKLFGFSKFIIRIPSVIMSMMVLFAGLGFLKISGSDRRTRIWWAVLFTILPFFIMAGRLGQDCNLMLGSAAIFMLCLAWALKDGRLRWFVLAGVACGAVLYTYVLSYFIMILFLIMMFVYLLYMKKLTLKQAICFCIPVAVIAAPLIIIQLINIFDLNTIKLWKFTLIKLPEYRVGELSMPKLGNFPKVFRAVFMYDWVGFSSNSKYYTLFKVSIPFFAVGFVRGIIKLVKNIRSRSFDMYDGLFIWFVAEWIVGMMIGGAGVTSYKMNGIYFSVLYYIVSGILTTVDFIKFKKTAAAVIAVVYAVFAVSFLKYYFTEEPDMRHRFMSDIYPEVVEFIESDEKLSELPVFMGYTYYIYYLVSALPSPYDIDMEHIEEYAGRYAFGLPDDVAYNACYVLFEEDWQYKEKLYPLGLQIKNFDNNITIMYPEY